MGVTVKITGIEKVQKNLNKELSKIKVGSLAGMIEAAIIVRRAMETSSPKTPVDTGNLRASWFTVTSMGKLAEGDGASFKGTDASKLSSQHNAVISNEKSAIGGSKPKVSMGFTANYALAVHENIEATFNRSGAGAKFFEMALKRNKKAMLEAIAKKAKIK